MSNQLLCDYCYTMKPDVRVIEVQEKQGTTGAVRNVTRNVCTRCQKRYLNSA